ncbi:MAG: FlgD immunoglobulin-like domain containing protein [Candidatus Bipolaricaulis sp.]|nr:FlgD immunoglobulin-like domain containing protein [Candidatus Bipolaricaulis sp.]
MVRKCLGMIGVVVAMAGLPLGATTAEMYFSSDQDGGTRVTNVQEGSQVWIVIVDADENIDCDVRDKIWTDVKLMDPKTGASIVWESYADAAPSAAEPLRAKRSNHVATAPYKGHYPGSPGSLAGDYLEETGADTGVFVSSRPFQIGTRESYSSSEPWKGTHIVDVAPALVRIDLNAEATAKDLGPVLLAPTSRSFQWGNYSFLDLHSETKGGDNADGDVLYWVGYIGFNSTAFGIGRIALGLSASILPSQLDGDRAGYGVWPELWLVGRFENMDTLIGMYQDPNDDSDIAVAMMKIVDTEATITWEANGSRSDGVIYKDGNEAATLTVIDPDENLNCSRVEYVPVFLIVNPGSWNPVNSADDDTVTTGDSPNNFCMLKRTGGTVGSYTTAEDPANPPASGILSNRPIRWFNIYNSEKNDYGTAGAMDGRYYIQYPKLGVFDLEDHGSLFDTVSANGVTAISFFARETGADTGVFELRLNSILADLGFLTLNDGDVLVAYYLDPNDEDDFKLATAYIGRRDHLSTVRFTDAARGEKSVYWLGRDAVYAQVIDENANVDPCCPEQVVVHLCDPHDEDDGEFWVLDETSMNSSTFFSNAGMQLLPVWDALGVGLPDLLGGYQLVLDNWGLEAYNEDEIYVRYNDVYYVDNEQGMFGLGDLDTATAYSGPRIDRVRAPNDVSFDLMSIADTQVYDGSTTKMHFLDRNGQRVTGYLNADCVFLEVTDDDQDEDLHRRERIAGFWDGGQNFPFGPLPLNEFDCTPERVSTHPVNALLGDTNIFNNSPDPYAGWFDYEGLSGAPRIYVLNPRSGRWAALDLLETRIDSGVFVSVICVDLVDVYPCVPTLDVVPGDTIVAVYQDPSNHSDSAMISIKVAVGGSGSITAGSSTTFIDAAGDEVTSYAQGDPIYVRVTDASHAQDISLLDAVTIGGTTYDLTAYGSGSSMFVTAPIVLDVAVGDVLTATYADPTDPTDTSSDSATIVSGTLSVTAFHAEPNPFSNEVAFTYAGSGTATQFTVLVYDLNGQLVWMRTEEDTDKVLWDGTNTAGRSLANGAYLYVVTATDGTNTFDPSNTPSARGTVFINR